MWPLRLPGLTWALLEWINTGKPTVFGTITGSIAGLATITAASGYVDVIAAMGIGFVASLVCFVCVACSNRGSATTTLWMPSAFTGWAAFLGLSLPGCSRRRVINPAGPDGALFGNPQQLLVQLVAVAVTLYSLVATYMIYKLVDVFVMVRVPTRDEILGLDLTQHNETAYTVIE